MRGYCRLSVLTLVFAISACSATPSPVVPTQGSHPGHFILQSGGPTPAPWLVLPSGEQGAFIDGPDGAMWSNGGFGYNLMRLDPATLTAEFFALPNSWDIITAGGDGNIWFCPFVGRGDGYIAPNGQVTIFYGPRDGCRSPTAGPDGNVWWAGRDPHHVRLVRITPTGVITSFPTGIEPNGVIWAVAGGKNGLVWFAFVGPYSSLVGNIDTATYKIRRWLVAADSTLYTLFTGADGNAYAFDSTTLDLYRITPNGRVTNFGNVLGSDPYPFQQPQNNVDTIWTVTNNGLQGWSVRTKTATLYPAPPSFNNVNNCILGTDYNVWCNAAVYIRRVLTITPPSATMNVGQQVSFSISETNCKLCIWSATSSNPGVASVGAVTGNTFSVTAVGSGMASIAVADRHQNVVQLPIDVQPDR